MMLLKKAISKSGQNTYSLLQPPRRKSWEMLRHIISELASMLLLLIESTVNSNQLWREKVEYTLLGAANHKGAVDQGHYTAYVKYGSKWYLCCDGQYEEVLYFHLKLVINTSESGYDR